MVVVAEVLLVVDVVVELDAVEDDVVARQHKNITRLTKVTLEPAA